MREESVMQEREVVVVDIKMPFWSIVVLMIKWAVATIPAAIVIWFVFALLSALFGGFGLSVIGPMLMR